MPTLQDGVSLVTQLRADNPNSGLEHMSDQDVASMVYDKTQDARLLPLKQSSALQRGANDVGNFFTGAGKSVEGAIAPEGSSFPRQVLGRVAGGAVSGAPQLGLGMLSATTEGIPRVLSALTGAGLTYAEDKAQTGDSGAALGSAAGYLASLAGGVKGAELGERVLGSKIGKFTAGTIGAAAGQAPGDYLSTVSQPGETASLSRFRSDPVGEAAYAAQQPIMGAAFEMAHKAVETRNQVAEANKQATPDLDDIVNKTDAEKLSSIQKKPAQDRSEMDLQNMKDIQSRMADLDSAKLSAKAKPSGVTPDLTQEVPSTLGAQVHLLNAQKKSVVQVPAGAELPNLDPWLQSYHEHTSAVDNNTYLYDNRKTNPDQIDNAIKTDSLGHLLGYGTAGVPKQPSGSVAVLRAKNGLEKAAVVLGDGNEAAVTKALSTMGMGDDKVSIETPQQVLDWRQRNQGLQTLHSIAAKPEDDISFSNHVMDMLQKAVTPSNGAGAKFTVDKDGKVGGAGLLQAVKKWAPPDIYDHYKAAGIETLLGSNKVKVSDFTNWLRQYTPEIEVKKLVPPDPNSIPPESDYRTQVARYQHQLESFGYDVDTDSHSGDVFIRKDGKELDPESSDYDKVPQEHRDLITKLQESFLNAEGLLKSPESDAATGKYGVEPKPLEQMPGAVDMLVRAKNGDYYAKERSPGRWATFRADGSETDEHNSFPNKEEAEKYIRNNYTDPLFRGPHFGNSDVNVLASIRGYIENHPTLGKIFHVFELQSDWGQRHSAQEQEVSNLEKTNPTELAWRRRNNANFANVKDHPLLSSYESLGLKAAIQHARSIGATHLAISDAETSMMTEGHDRAAGFQADPDEWLDLTPEERAQKYKERPAISQEKGMRAAYDERLPNLMKKLTGDSGRKVDFGPHKMGDPDATGFSTGANEHENGSPVFKNPDGTPKTNITARVFDISNPRAEVKRLFSLYDADAQANLEHSLAVEDRRLSPDGDRDPEELTPKSFLDRAVRGDSRVTNDALLKFWSQIKGDRGVLREQNFMESWKQAKIDLPSKDITFNRNMTLKVNEAFRLMTHELTHGAIQDLMRANPEAFKYLTDHTEALGQPARQAILENLKQKLNLGDKFNPEYLSGKLFDPKDPFLLQKQAHEFSAGLMEAVAEAHMDKLSAPEWMKWIPEPVQKVLQGVVEKIKTFFGKNASPSMSDILNPDQASRLQKIADTLHEHVMDQRDANYNALLKLKNTEAFSNDSFVDRLPQLNDDLRGALRNNIGGDGELYSFGKSLAKAAGGLLDKIENKYEDNFYSALFRARTKPYTADFFWTMHKMRPTVQSEIYGYHAFLGQKSDGSLSREQSLERAGKFIESLTSPFNSSRDRILGAFSRVFEENTNRREEAIAAGQEVDPSKLVTQSEMQSKFGLNAEQSEFLDRLTKIPELVAKEQARKAEVKDTIDITKLFYKANRQQDIEGVRQRVTRLNRIANDFGAKRFEMDWYNSKLRDESRQAEPDQALMDSLKQRVAVLTAEQDQFKKLMDINIRQEFAGAIPFKQDGPDPFINGISEAMTRMSALRFNQRYITKDPGYAPMTRRGRFLLRVYEPNELGAEFAKVREMKGFDKESEMNQYIKDNNITDFEKIDKDTLRGRAQVFTPDKLKLVRDQAKAQLNDLIQQVSDGSMGQMEPNLRGALLDTLNDFSHSFQPLEDEIKSVVSVQGDKFKERRYLVPGFDRNDYLPNIFEYLDYKTVSGNKEIAKAEGALQLERPEIVGDPDLSARMAKELNYNLGNQSEFSGLRKAIYYYYLGASVRHIVQYGLQIPLNGISQMVAEGSGFDAYKHFANGARMASRYSLKGTTGDTVIDSLLKQAVKDGSTLSTAIEAPLHETVTIQNALDAINARHEGTLGFGEKLGYLGTQAAKSFEKFLMSTSSASDEANKKTTFIASILAERAKGTTDIRQLYTKATDFTNFVNFVGDKPNRPGYLIKEGGSPMHGPLLLLSTLQSFVINHISQLYSFYNKGFRQGSAPDRAAFATGIAHLLAFSGSMGMVGASLSEQLFQEATNISLRTALRKAMVTSAMSFSHETDPHGPAAHLADRIADGVLYGLPGILGIDASNSIGLGDPFFHYEAGEPLGAETFGGAGVGIAGRVVQAAHDIKVDPFNPQQWFSATRAAAPAFLSNSIKAYDVLNQGATLNTKGQPVGEPLGIAGSVSQLLGFSPEQTSKERDFQTQVYDQTKLHGEEYQRNVVNASRYLADYERTGNPEDLQKANETFSKYVSSTGNLQDRDAMVDSIAKEVMAAQGKVTSPASLKESVSRQSLETSFPSVTSHYPSQVSSELESLKVSQLLGQDDVTARKMQEIPSSLLEKVLTDALTGAGVRPEQVQQYLRPGTLLKQGPAQTLRR